MFSICYAQNGGLFTIGNPSSAFNSNTTYIDYSSGNGFYTVSLSDIMLNDQDFKISNYQNYFTIIDSGTTLSMFPDSLFNSIMGQFNEFCNFKDKCLGKRFISSEGTCFFLNIDIDYKTFMESMPIIVFVFEGQVNYNWKPDYYLYKDIPDNDKGESYCLGFTSWRYINKRLFLGVQKLC